MALRCGFRGYVAFNWQASEFSPTFSPDGTYLYFASNRDFNLAFSAYEFNYLYNDATRIYAAAVSADAKPLFAPESDEITIKEDDADKKDDASDKQDKSDKKDASDSRSEQYIWCRRFAERVVALRRNQATTKIYKRLKAVC